MNPTPPNFFYVYILKIFLTNWLYIGYTSNLQKRIKKHNSGKAFSTKQHLPLKLIYYEAFRSRIDATNRETSLKLHAKTLSLLKDRIHNSLQYGGVG